MTRIARTQAKPDQETPAERSAPETLTKMAQAPAADRSAPGKLTKMARAPAGAEAGREPARGIADAPDNRHEEDRGQDRHEAGRGPAEGSAEFQRLFAEFAAEQTRQTIDTLGACTRAGSWTDLASAQGRLFTDSLMRIGQLNARCGELLLRGMTAAPAAFRR